ncbi:MAG: hypothetical protein WCP79_11955 [Bacillota bacterium]
MSFEIGFKRIYPFGYWLSDFGHIEFGDDEKFTKQEWEQYFRKHNDQYQKDCEQRDLYMFVPALNIDKWKDKLQEDSEEKARPVTYYLFSDFLTENKLVDIEEYFSANHEQQKGVLDEHCSQYSDECTRRKATWLAPELNITEYPEFSFVHWLKIKELWYSDIIYIEEDGPKLNKLYSIYEKDFLEYVNRNKLTYNVFRKYKE